MTIQLNPTTSDTYETKTLEQLRQMVFDGLGFLNLLSATKTETLEAIRDDIFNMLGFAAMTASPPPGVVPMLNSFINEAQQTLFRTIEFGTGSLPAPPIMVNEKDMSAIDGTAIRQLALGMAKAHYSQEDGQLYLAQSGKYLSDLKDRTPPNSTSLVNRIIKDAQMMLYRTYKVFRMERWFSWTFVAGQRFYSITRNDERLPISSPSNIAVNPGTAGNYGSMGFAREEFSAVLLTDGRIFVAGGFDGVATNQPTAEIYDPTAGLYTTTGTMTQSRRTPFAVVLGNGTVLVGGGFNGVPLASAEIYNPATGVFTPISTAMNGARYASTATLLQNGKVLITGGSNNDGTYVATAELYAPSTQTFTATGSMGAVRGYHTATLLPNGKVLIAGGITTAGAVSNTAELYDPDAGTFSATGGLTTAVEGHTATLLGNGSVSIIGGITSPFGPSVSNKAQIYSPSAGTFSNSSGNLSTGRGSHIAALLPNGKVLVAGGIAASGTPIALSDTELFDPAAGTFSAGGAMATARQSFGGVYSPYTLKLYVMGGIGLSGPSSLTSTEIYDYISNTFSPSGQHSSGTRAYRVAFVDYNGKTTLAAAEVSNTIPGDTSAIITWDLPTNPNVRYAVIYGRAAGVELLIAQVDAYAGQYIDYGTNVPSGALPTVNTTGNTGPVIDQRSISWAGISKGDVAWRPLRKGVPPVTYSALISGIPEYYDVREQIEVWPPPVDSTWLMRIKGYFVPGPFEADLDVTSIDWQAVYLQALANAKAIYKRPDAQLSAAELTSYVGSLVAGTHGTERYRPGAVELPNAVRPVLLDINGNPVA